MHPVVEHILARKGKTAPFDDGRSIALLHLGGLMTGVRGAGALAALQELGLGSAFDEIYATSAGLANACYFLSGDMRSGASIYYEDLCSGEFINLERVWDIVNIDYVLEILRTKKPLDYAKVAHSPTKLYARLYNMLEKQAEYKPLNGLAPEEIERALHAAISLPYLDPGSVEIEDTPYKDADLAKKEDEFKAIADTMLTSSATDVLVLYNYPEQFDYMLNAGMLDSERLYQIVPYREEDLSRVSTDSHELKKAAEAMGSLVKSIFGSDEDFVL